MRKRTVMQMDTIHFQCKKNLTCLLRVDTLLDCARMDRLVSTIVVVSKWRMDGWIWWLWAKNEGWTDTVLWLVVAKFESSRFEYLKIQIQPFFPWDEKGENRPSEKSGWVLAIWRLIAKCKRNGGRTGNPWQIAAAPPHHIAFSPYLIISTHDLFMFCT